MDDGEAVPLVAMQVRIIADAADQEELEEVGYFLSSLIKWMTMISIFLGLFHYISRLGSILYCRPQSLGLCHQFSY